MSFRALAIVSVTLLTLPGCGGGNSPNGGGGSGLSISLLSPSLMMVGLPVAGTNVYGTGFTPQSQVLIDGQAVSQTILAPDGSLQVEFDPSFWSPVGVHQFSVQNGNQVSNSLPFTIYAPQQGPFVMQALPGFQVGERAIEPPYVVAADVDGDGLADLIINDSELGYNIAILHGQADGLLSASQLVSVPVLPYALAVGDVDGGGTPDLVPITSDNSSTTAVYIMSGDGHGNFQQPVMQQTFPGIYPGPAYLADLEGTGRLDLVLQVEKPTGLTSILWLKNTGGAFAAPVTLGTSYGHTFAIADFNRDGKPDIVYVAPGSTPAMHMLVNQGNGKFTDQLPPGLTGVAGVPNVIDFNLDGIPDLVIQATYTGGQLYSFQGNGNGSFTQVAVSNPPPAAQLVVGDFDHDGFPDLAGPGGNEPAELIYLYGDGHGNFVPQAVVGPAGQYTAVGDFNGDGIPDVVVADNFNFVTLSLGRTDRNYPSPVPLFPATVTGVSTGDITGSGRQDILSVGNYIDVSIPGTVFLNQGGNSFQLAAYVDPTAGFFADLTGKGVVDLLGGNYYLEIWPNNLTPGFSPSPMTTTQPNSLISVYDMDGDGHPDIVSGTGQILYGEGAYQFTPVTLSSGNFGLYVVGDFNGDGKLDIASASGTFLNTAGRTFRQVANNNLPFINGTQAIVGDFNGDGKDDVAAFVPGGAFVGVYYSRGDGTFYLATVLDAGQAPAFLAAGDFDGDGRLDIAVGLNSSQLISILFNAGGGKFARSFFASGALVGSMTEADLNHTGKPDLVIGNFVYVFAPPNVNVVFHK